MDKPDIRKENMELTLMFVGSEDILSKCRQPRREILELASEVISKRHYGTMLDYLRVTVVFQDTGMIETRTSMSRKRKEVSVEVELSKEWVRNADDSEIKLALLKCLLRAAEIVGQHIDRANDDFDIQALTADLGGLTARVQE